MTAQPQELNSVNQKKKTRLASLPALARPLKLRMDNPMEEVRIEIVPLIDVIFCILTFFILAAVGLSRQQAISVNLPKASTGTPQGREILVVSLDEVGQVYIEKEPVITKDDFLQKLQTYRQQNPLGVMALYASPNASYNDVVQVLDLLREVGGDRVALATIPGNSQETPAPNSYPPPATGVPGFSPYTDPNSINPYGTVNPYGQPQLPINPGQPSIGLPGTPSTNPGQPSIGLPGSSSTSPTQPPIGLPGTPSTNPQLPSGQSQSNPGTSVTPNSSTTTTPSTNNSGPQRR
ncbi:MAG TPA: biopolymer transporter ExbD [Cyanobacteria bacterium UBA12227]|nr:biopolymer transporter ExbD [Cyanobacteria bacterium UBA12227]